LRTLASRTGLFGIGTLVDEYLRGGRHAVVRTLGQVFENCAPSTQQHEGFIHGDARQPSREPRLFLKVVEVKEDLVKRFLHNIFGILPIIRYSLRNGEDSPFVTKNQLVESLCISTLCGSHQHAVGVFIHITRPKLLHTSIPPRDLSKRQSTLNKAIEAPDAAGDLTTWEMADRMGDGSFQRILAGAGASANLSGYRQLSLMLE
jgi:hypothetical protein